MPAHSRFAEAIADDEELAAAMLHDATEGSATRPRLSTWDPMIAEMRTLNERVGVLTQFTAALARSKYDPPPLPRPETALERVRRSYQLERHRRITAQVLPDDQEGPP